jgi:hypothetical protein
MCALLVSKMNLLESYYDTLVMLVLQMASYTSFNGRCTCGSVKDSVIVKINRLCNGSIFLILSLFVYTYLVLHFQSFII